MVSASHQSSAFVFQVACPKQLPDGWRSGNQCAQQWSISPFGRIEESCDRYIPLNGAAAAVSDTSCGVIFAHQGYLLGHSTGRTTTTPTTVHSLTIHLISAFCIHDFSFLEWPITIVVIPGRGTS